MGKNMRMRIPMLAAALVATFSLAAHATPPMAAGGMYADAKGMTLYTFDKDPASGPSACSGGCSQAWPAAMADASDKPQGDWTIVPTADGGNQWAYKGKRVYTFSKDKKPGDAMGDNFKDMWHTVKQ
jgi:predicted lipoprotein with Yx(FWY)xxD motif